MLAKENMAQLDHLDWQILHLLQQNARLTFTDISRQVHLSLSAVAERVHKLEAGGILMGYHARVNPEQVGFPIQAFIRITTRREYCDRVVALAQSLPEVREGYRLTGTESHILKVYATSLHHLETLIDAFTDLGDVVTSIALSMPVWKSSLERPAGEAS